MILWGFNFIAVKELTEFLPPFLAIGLRFFIVSLILVPFVKFPKEHLFSLYIYSLLIGIGHFGLLFLGIRYLGAGLSSVLIQAEVVFLAMIGLFFLGEKVTKKFIFGFVIAFIGVIAILLEKKAGKISEFNLIGGVFVLLSGIFWAFSNLYMKLRLRSVPLFSLMGWLGLFTFPQALILSYFMEGGTLSLVLDMPVRALLSLFYITFASSFFAYYVWYRLLRTCPLSQLAPFLLLIPLVATAAGIALKAEEVSLWRMGGAFLVLAGVSLL